MLWRRMLLQDTNETRVYLELWLAYERALAGDDDDKLIEAIAELEQHQAEHEGWIFDHYTLQEGGIDIPLADPNEPHDCNQCFCHCQEGWVWDERRNVWALPYAMKKYEDYKRIGDE